MKRTYYHAVLPNFDVVTDGGSFNGSPCSNMNVVPYLHRVIIEIPSIRLVRRPTACPPHPRMQRIVRKKSVVISIRRKFQPSLVALAADQLSHVGRPPFVLSRGGRAVVW